MDRCARLLQAWQLMSPAAELDEKIAMTARQMGLGKEGILKLVH